MKQLLLVQALEFGAAMSAVGYVLTALTLGALRGKPAAFEECLAGTLLVGLAGGIVYALVRRRRP